MCCSWQSGVAGTEVSGRVDLCGRLVFFKQKTAYEMRISDWSSDVCSSNLLSRDDDTKAIPVLIVSTKGMETDKAWGLRQGAKDYIVKPPREDELIARINALLGS